MTVWRGARILHGHSLASVWPRGGSADATGEYDGRATTTVSRHGDDQRPHHDHQKEHHRHHHHDHHQHHQAPPPPPSEDAEITTAVVAALAQLAEEIARLTGSPRGPRLIFPANTFDTSTSTASTISLRIQIAMPSTFWDYLLPSWQRVPPKSSAFVKGGRRGRNTGAGPLPPSMPSLSTTLGDETNFIIAQVAREVRTVAVSLADTYRFLHAGLVEDGKTNTGPVVLLDRATGFMGCPRGGPVWLFEQIQRLTDDTARCEIKRASSPPPGGGHDRSDHSRFADSSTTTLPSAYVSDSPPPYPPGLSSPVRPRCPTLWPSRCRESGIVRRATSCPPSAGDPCPHTTFVDHVTTRSATNSETRRSRRGCRACTICRVSYAPQETRKSFGTARRSGVCVRRPGRYWT